jgi:hypothetical protein
MHPIGNKDGTSFTDVPSSSDDELSLSESSVDGKSYQTNAQNRRVKDKF